MTERIKLLMTQDSAENIVETKNTFDKYGIAASFCPKDGEDVIARIAAEQPDVVADDLPF